jgi:hypothetical protein
LAAILAELEPARLGHQACFAGKSPATPHSNLNALRPSIAAA